jgi:hypothetical protein
MARNVGRINAAGAAALNPGQVKPKRARKPAARRGRLATGQCLALLVGGVGTFVLALSVWECTTALHSLTGMPPMLAGLLAVGIDLGMVATEMAAIVSDKASDAYRWAERYIGLAVGLSVVLNAAAAAAHATGWLVLVAVPVGGVVPVFVYIAGRVAGALWTGK